MPLLVLNTHSRLKQNRGGFVMAVHEDHACLICRLVCDALGEPLLSREKLGCCSLVELVQLLGY